MHAVIIVKHFKVIMHSNNGESKNLTMADAEIVAAQIKPMNQLAHLLAC